MDRLDYLARDSFYSGVAEGKVGSERIIKMLAVVGDQLVVEEKGIYSIEKFITARRLMYWQVYLHRTVLCAEHMLMSVLKRAKELAMNGEDVFATPALRVFLCESLDRARFLADPDILERFCELDDSDVLSALKAWTHHSDSILSNLSRRIISRDLLRIELRPEPFTEAEIEACRQAVAITLGISESDAQFYVLNDRIDNQAYGGSGITIKFKDGRLADFADASDHMTHDVLTRKVEKSFICYPKNVLRPLL